MNELKLLKEKANSNIHDLLDILKVEYTEKGFYLSSSCPVHGGDNKNGWSWHLSRGVWQCYTSHCHSENDADIYGLIRGIKECSFREAKEWLRRNLGSTSTRIEAKEIMDQISNREFVNQTKRLASKNKVYNPSCLSKLDYHPYLESRGYSREVVEKYNAGISRLSNSYMSNRIIFPIFNIKNEIVGFTGRVAYSNWEEIGPKWIHSKNYHSSCNLFNINNAAEHIRKTGTVIIVEGPLDVLRLEQYGVRNSVALLGKILHNRQVSLLMSIPCDNIKFALDADSAGRSGAKKALELAKSLFGVEIIDLPEGKDCGDLTKEEAERIFYDCYAKT